MCGLWQGCYDGFLSTITRVKFKYCFTVLLQPAPVLFGEVVLCCLSKRLSCHVYHLVWSLASLVVWLPRSTPSLSLSSPVYLLCFGLDLFFYIQPRQLNCLGSAVGKSVGLEHRKSWLQVPP